MNSKNLNVKPVVFITGASGSIGSAITYEFIERGWMVVAGFLTRNIFQNHENLLPLKMDVSDCSQVKERFKMVQEKFGRLDCLVNSAAIVCDELIFSMSAMDWDNVVNVNLNGTMNCTREAIAIMKENGGGHIINFSSISAKTGRAGQANYAASKAAVVGFSMCLAKELGCLNIKVNVVVPGFIESKMTLNIKDEVRKNILKANVLGRSVTSEEVAKFCYFLANTNNISGQVFHLDNRVTRWI